MPPSTSPTPPAKTGGPDRSWHHRRLYENVIKTLYALPEEFRTSLRISDFRATDIFTLNSALGASIEDAVVNAAPKVIAAMVEDVYREGKGEFVESREATAAIGRKTAELLKKHLAAKLHT